MQAAAAVNGGVDREYETIYVLRPDVEKARAEDIAARLRDVIAKGGGTLTRVENWGRRVLAYAVSRHKRGVYVYLRFLGRGDLVSELERNLRMLDTVIKFQTVKVTDIVPADRYSVNEEDVKFEHVEHSGDEEEEESLARTLGLEGDFNPDQRGRDTAADEEEGDLEGGEEGAADEEGT
jgi:small subunit ribosomal protein S6